jgi:hypothetical protein
MNYKLVKIIELSGSEASVYSLYSEDEKCTLFEKFISENTTSFKSETIDILKRLKSIARKEGAREHYFKIREGKPGDLVCALYDMPKGNLRLYCIRLGGSLIILGGGGHKPKTIRALQSDPKLSFENRLMVKLSDELLQRIKSKEIVYVNEYMDLEGDLDFEF